MSYLRIGLETVRFSDVGSDTSSLDRLSGLIDWAPIEAVLGNIYTAAGGGRTSLTNSMVRI